MVTYFSHVRQKVLPALLQQRGELLKISVDFLRVEKRGTRSGEDTGEGERAREEGSTIRSQCDPQAGISRKTTSTCCFCLKSGSGFAEKENEEKMEEKQENEHEEEEKRSEAREVEQNRAKRPVQMRQEEKEECPRVVSLAPLHPSLVPNGCDGKRRSLFFIAPNAGKGQARERHRVS